MLEDNIYTLYT